MLELHHHTPWQLLPASEHRLVVGRHTELRVSASILCRARDKCWGDNWLTLMRRSSRETYRHARRVSGLSTCKITLKAHPTRFFQRLSPEREITCRFSTVLNFLPLCVGRRNQKWRNGVRLDTCGNERLGCRNLLLSNPAPSFIAIIDLLCRHVAAWLKLPVREFSKILEHLAT